MSKKMMSPTEQMKVYELVENCYEIAMRQIEDNVEHTTDTIQQLHAIGFILQKFCKELKELADTNKNLKKTNIILLEHINIDDLKNKKKKKK